MIEAIIPSILGKHSNLLQGKKQIMFRVYHRGESTRNKMEEEKRRYPSESKNSQKI